MLGRDIPVKTSVKTGINVSVAEKARFNDPFPSSDYPEE